MAGMKMAGNEKKQGKNIFKEYREYTDNLFKNTLAANPLKRFSDLFSNLEFVSGDSEAVKQLIENLDPFIRRRNRRVIYYLRVYSSLLYAASYFERNNLDRTRQYLELAYNTELRVKMPGEQQYIKKIRSLIDVVFDTLKREKPENINRDRMRTRMHIAQNVCVLRMLYS
jgi:hypothetical protein